MAVVGHLHIAGQDNYGGPLPRAISASHRIALVTLDDDGATIHHEHERPSEGDDRERLIAGVEHEGSHTYLLGGTRLEGEF